MTDDVQELAKRLREESRAPKMYLTSRSLYREAADALERLAREYAELVRFLFRSRPR